MFQRYPLMFALISGTVSQTVIATDPWLLDGFDMPESVLVDTDRQQLIVSNIVGHPGEADGEGYLSRLTLDGTIIERRWVTGLDAPKGMALVAGELIVADLDRLHRINAETGVLVESLAPEGAQFLNDVTTDGDTAWISDLLSNTLWRYGDATLEPWLTDEALAHPNGLLFDGPRLLVGSWGNGLEEDFTTVEPGALLAVDLNSKAVTIVAPSIGNLDGVVRMNAQIFVSDWITGALFEVDEVTGIATERMRLPEGLADIGAGDGMLYLPLMLDGQVQGLPLQ